MLKNDTLKNGTSRIGLYGSAPPPPGVVHTTVFLDSSVLDYICGNVAQGYSASIAF